MFPLEKTRLCIAQTEEMQKSQKFKKLFKKTRVALRCDSTRDKKDGFLKKKFVPEKLHHRVIVWYHHFLCHPGASRLADTLEQTMIWPGLTAACKYYTRRCEICQRLKKNEY